MPKNIFRFTLFSLLALCACRTPIPLEPTGSAPREVLTTVGMIADVAQNVAGVCFTVRPLMGPGTDPHTYRATARDSRTLGRAELILYGGYSLEGEFGELLGRLGERRATLAVSEAAVPQADLLRTDTLYGVDPHVWMDVALWSRTADAALRALGRLEPDCRETMQVNARAYRVQLAALDAWVRESLGSIPEQQRVLVTAHDAFGYYARAYGLTVVGIQGISTASEAAISDIRRVVDTVADRRVPAIFIESSVNARTVSAVQQAAAARGITVRVGGSLYSDALGEAGTAAGTYIGMMVHNTRTVAEALGGSAPPLPAGLDVWAEVWE